MADAPFTKPVPITVKVKSAPAGVTLTGDVTAMKGTGLVTAFRRQTDTAIATATLATQRGTPEPARSHDLLCGSTVVQFGKLKKDQGAKRGEDFMVDPPLPLYA